MRCVFTEQAETDSETSGDYIAQDNPGRALSFIEEIRQRCDRILDTPKAAPQALQLDGLSIRRVVYGRYLVFYATTEEAIVVLRGARDLEWP